MKNVVIFRLGKMISFKNHLKKIDRYHKAFNLKNSIRIFLREKVRLNIVHIDIYIYKKRKYLQILYTYK